jgi:hypothetical protein
MRCAACRRPLTKEQAAAAENLLTVMERFRLVRPLVPVHLISASPARGSQRRADRPSYAEENGVGDTVMSRATERGARAWNHAARLGAGPRADHGDPLAREPQAPRSLSHGPGAPPDFGDHARPMRAREEGGVITLAKQSAFIVVLGNLCER